MEGSEALPLNVIKSLQIASGGVGDPRWSPCQRQESGDSGDLTASDRAVDFSNASKQPLILPKIGR